MAVERLAGRQSATIIAANRVEERRRVGSAHLIDTHMRHIEQPRCTARRQVLFIDTRVLHRHLPTCKGDHPSAYGFMDLVQRSTFQLPFGVAPLE